MLIAEAILLTTLADAYGAPLAEYYFFPDNPLLYVRWHGQLTAAEVIRGALEATRLLEQHSLQRILNDKCDTGGDWSEALPWLEYEWLPRTMAAGLRAIAYIISSDLHARIVSKEFVEAMQKHIQISLFTNEADAQKWLQTQ